MGAIFKASAFLAVLAAAIGAYLYTSFDGKDVRIASLLSQEPSIPPAGPAAKADIDEELDYLVARRIASIKGWRDFLQNHPDGKHVPLAQAEVRKLAPDGDASLGEATAAAVARPQSAPADAEPDSDESCKIDEQRLAELRAKPSSAAARRFADELLCERLRPQVMALIDAPAVADAAPGARAAAEPTHEASPPATAESAPAADDACKREEDLLALLRTSQEVSGLLKTLRCESLRPRLLALMDQLDRSSKAEAGPGAAGTATAEAASADPADAPPATVKAEGAAPPPSRDATAAGSGNSSRSTKPDAPQPVADGPPADVASANRTVPPAASAGVEVAALAPSRDAGAATSDAASEGDAQGAFAGGRRVAAATEEDCRRDEQRLVGLRNSPSISKVVQFAGELRCEKLRPQLARLAESLDDAMASPHAALETPPAPQGAPQQGATASACASDQDALNRIRAQPSPNAVQDLWRNLGCERLRPQVRLLLESLGLTADPSGACRREAEELKRIRSNPDRLAAENFARDVKCDDLKPQAARLVESLSE